MPEFDPNSARNPSSGLYGRNPTEFRREVAEYAEDQSDIVKAIRDSGVKRMRISLDYSDIDKANPPPLSGILGVREMTPEQAQQFGRALMRARPNIFKVDISLGNYPSARPIQNGKTRMLSSHKPRFHTELGDKIGEVLADSHLNVTRILYTVHNAEPGHFNATAEVYGTTAEEYEDDQLFKPTLTYEYIKTT